jgi:hypothetical protein
MPWDRKKMEGLSRPLRTSEPFLIITESTTAIHIFTSKNCVKPSKHLVASFSWQRSCHMNYISYIKDIRLAEASYSHEIVLKTIVISNKEIFEVNVKKVCRRTCFCRFFILHILGVYKLTPVNKVSIISTSSIYISWLKYINSCQLTCCVIGKNE